MRCLSSTRLLASIPFSRHVDRPPLPRPRRVVDEITAEAVDQAVAASVCMIEQFREEMLAPHVTWLQLERRVQELEAAAAEQGARQSRQAEEDVAMGPAPAAEE